MNNINRHLGNSLNNRHQGNNSSINNCINSKYMNSSNISNIFNHLHSNCHHKWRCSHLLPRKSITIIIMNLLSIILLLLITGTSGQSWSRTITPHQQNLFKSSLWLPQVLK